MNHLVRSSIVAFILFFQILFSNTSFGLSATNSIAGLSTSDTTLKGLFL